MTIVITDKGTNYSVPLSVFLFYLLFFTFFAFF